MTTELQWIDGIFTPLDSEEMQAALRSMGNSEKIMFQVLTSHRSMIEQRDALLNALQSLLTDYRYVKSWCQKNGSQWVGSSQGVDIDAIRAIAQCGGGK